MWKEIYEGRTMKESLEKILSIFKLTPFYWLVLFLACTIILFTPAKFLTPIGLDNNFLKGWPHLIVGLIWLLTALLLVCYAVKKACFFIRNVITRRSLKSLNDTDKKIYMGLVEKTAELLRLSEWDSWTAAVLGPAQCFKDDIYFKIDDFRTRVFNCLWPGSLPELERAFKTLSMILKDFADTFGEHSELRNDTFRGVKFYQISEWDPERYQKLFKEWEEWVKKCDDLIWEATKAVNWLADVVRRELNPDFFITKGKFTLTTGMYEDMSYRKHIPEYSKKEKKGMPYRSPKK